jgi:cytoskeletal protein CcmA (bactofilin family)
MMMRRLVVALFGLFMGMHLIAHGQEQTPRAAQRDIGTDHFAFGGSVRIDKSVAGDLIAAGGNIDVEAPVTGDAVLAGGNVRVSSSVGQNVYAGGGRVFLDGAIGRNLRIGGGQVEVGPKATIAGNVTAGGGQLVLRGPVTGVVQIGGGRVLIDSAVTGDVICTAGQLELGPNARLAGKLRYFGRDEIKRDPAAQVAGAIERMPQTASAGMPHHERGSRVSAAGAWLFWIVGLMVLAAVLLFTLPVSSENVSLTAQTRFGFSVLVGFILLVCVPVAALILLISIIGIPLALLVLLLYPALLLVGYVASGMAAGGWALARFKADAAGRTGWRIASAMLAVLLLALVARIPFIGGFVAFVAVLAGVGAIALQVFTKGPKAANPASNTAAVQAS